MLHVYTVQDTSTWVEDALYSGLPKHTCITKHMCILFTTQAHGSKMTSIQVTLNTHAWATVQDTKAHGLLTV